MAKKEKYLVLNKQNEHEYTIICEESERKTEISLFSSKADIWNDHAKNELQLSLVDNGDEVIFDRELKTLDYANLFSLRLLLNFKTSIDENKNNREKCKIIKKKNLIKL